MGLKTHFQKPSGIFVCYRFQIKVLINDSSTFENMIVISSFTDEKMLKSLCMCMMSFNTSYAKVFYAITLYQRGNIPLSDQPFHSRNLKFCRVLGVYFKISFQKNFKVSKYSKRQSYTQFDSRKQVIDR